MQITAARVLLLRVLYFSTQSEDYASSPLLLSVYASLTSHIKEIHLAGLVALEIKRIQIERLTHQSVSCSLLDELIDSPEIVASSKDFALAKTLVKLVKNLPALEKAESASELQLK